MAATRKKGNPATFLELWRVPFTLTTCFFHLYLFCHLLPFLLEFLLPRCYLQDLHVTSRREMIFTSISIVWQAWAHEH